MQTRGKMAPRHDELEAQTLVAVPACVAGRGRKPASLRQRRADSRAVLLDGKGTMKRRIARRRHTEQAAVPAGHFKFILANN